MSLYPDLEALSDASFSGIVEILRRSKWHRKRTETLELIEKNLEEYLEMTTFG